MTERLASDYLRDYRNHLLRERRDDPDAEAALAAAWDEMHREWDAEREAARDSPHPDDAAWAIEREAQGEDA